MNYSTCVGGGLVEEGLGIAVDSTGNAYVVGYTTSISTAALPDHPRCRAENTNQSLLGLYSGFFFKLDPNRTGTAQLVYSTYLGCTLSGRCLSALAPPMPLPWPWTAAISLMWRAGPAASADKFAGTGFPTANAIQAYVKRITGRLFLQARSQPHRDQAACSTPVISAAATPIQTPAILSTRPPASPSILAAISISPVQLPPATSQF